MNDENTFESEQEPIANLLRGRRERKRTLLQAGQRFAGYTIVEEIQRGGMGCVYKAIKEGLTGTPVALKLMRPHVLNDARLKERFRREAQVLEKLNDPRICRYRDSGEFEGLPYIVMEYVDGPVLSDIVAQQKLPSASDIRGYIKIIRECAMGLHVAHEKGLVHRDIKPSNLALRHDGSPVILDFGIVQTPDGDALTIGSQHPGTAEYKAPEQHRRFGTVDRRADLYSLGMVLFELVARKRPFDDVAKKLSRFTAPSVSVINRKAGRWLATVLKRAMTRDPNQRYQSALEFAKSLECLLNGVKPPVKVLVNWRPIGFFVCTFTVLALGTWLFLRPETIDPPSHVVLSAARPCTDLLGDCVDPELSPDGARLAFVWRQSKAAGKSKER